MGGKPFESKHLVEVKVNQINEHNDFRFNRLVCATTYVPTDRVVSIVCEEHGAWRKYRLDKSKTESL